MMKIKHYVDVPGCPVEVTLDLIDGRWKGVVLFHLLDAGRLRFNALHKRLPGITQRLLTKQLRELEEAGLVSRKVYAEVPPRVEYRVTEEGESLRPIFDALARWGEMRLARHQAAKPKPAPGKRGPAPQADVVAADAFQRLLPQMPPYRRK